MIADITTATLALWPWIAAVAIAPCVVVRCLTRDDRVAAEMRRFERAETAERFARAEANQTAFDRAGVTR